MNFRALHWKLCNANSTSEDTHTHTAPPTAFSINHLLTNNHYTSIQASRGAVWVLVIAPLLPLYLPQKPY